MTVIAANEVIVDNRIVSIKVGTVVEVDGWKFAEKLKPSDWDKAAFRIDVLSSGPIRDLAINVVVIGRTIRYKRGSEWVRVSIEFVGDGEPSTMHRGYAKVD